MRFSENIVKKLFKMTANRVWKIKDGNLNDESN